MSYPNPATGTLIDRFDKVFRCGSCEGSGVFEDTCWTCEGDGEVEQACWSCDGDGTDVDDDSEDCCVCHGSGVETVSCEYCIGSGYDDEQCMNCDGDGYDQPTRAQEDAVALVDEALDYLHGSGWQVLKGPMCCMSCSMANADPHHLPLIGYHEQDVEHARDGSMYLFHDLGDFDGSGREAIIALERAGLTVDWDGSDATRIRVAVSRDREPALR